MPSLGKAPDRIVWNFVNRLIQVQVPMPLRIPSGKVLQVLDRAWMSHYWINEEVWKCVNLSEANKNLAKTNPHPPWPPTPLSSSPEKKE